MCLNDKDGGVIKQASANLTSLPDSVNSGFRTENLWFTTGPRYTVFLKLLMPLIPVSFIFLFIVCIKALRDQILGATLTLQQLKHRLGDIKITNEGFYMTLMLKIERSGIN